MEGPDIIREPAVAGKFYPASASELRGQIETLIDKKADKSDVTACVLPHAGYVYSGGVAGATISCANIKDKVILLGPNHTGYGAAYSVMAKGVWKTPLGELRIDQGLAEAILNNCSYLRADDQAHRYEHSLEVELPFLQYFKGRFEIVPIIFLSEDLSALKEIGKSIAAAITQRGLNDSALIVASSDMTHYESKAQAEKKDKEAIEAILQLDEDKLADNVRRMGISMCGFAPVAAMISAAKALGAKRARLIRYQTSADVTQDQESVVGYAGIIIY